MPSKKRATPVSLQPLDALFGTNEETTNGISEIAIGSLHPFTNHPFQVRDDKKMEELAESITQYGVLVPGIVRLRESGGYELAPSNLFRIGPMLTDFHMWRPPVVCFRANSTIPPRSRRTPVPAGMPTSARGCIVLFRWR